MTKLNPAGSAAVFSTFARRHRPSTRPAASSLDAAGNAWFTGRHELHRLPGHAPDAADTTFNGGRRRRHRRAQRRPARRCCSRPSSAARTRRAAPTSRRDSDRRHLRHRLTPSRRTSRPRSARSTRSGTATSDLLGRRVRDEARRSTPTLDATVAAAGARPRRRCLRRPTPQPQPQPITFDWNDVPECRVVHHPDRRLERVQRTAGARAVASPRRSTPPPGSRPRRTSGVSAASTWPASPARGRRLRSFTPQTAPPPAALGPRREPVHGRRRRRLERHHRERRGARHDASISLSSSNPRSPAFRRRRRSRHGFTGHVHVTTSAVAATTRS